MLPHLSNVYSHKLKLLSLAIMSLSAMALASPANAATKPATKTASKTSTTKTSVTKAASSKTTPTKTTTKASPTKTTPTQSTTTTVTHTEVTPIAASTITLVPVVAEPTITTTTYPKANAITFVGTDITAQPLTGIATPSFSISQAQFIPTVLVPKTTNNTGNVDVSVVDDFIAYAMPMARHYPPVFPSRTVRYNTTQRLKGLTAWIENYAKDPNASYEVLLRAAKLNAMGRNLDLGSDYTVRASDYIARAIKLQDTGEANFLYGMMLAEGGGFTEAEKYLDKAAKLGYAEAYQSMAQSDLLNDKKDKALQRLTEFKAKYPNDPYIDRQIAIVNSGKYYIWDLPAVPVQATP